MKQRILLVGGSGQVGQILRRWLGKRGHKIKNISRKGADGWDGKHFGAWTEDLANCDVLINLAGRSVDCRYNETNRRFMLDSRVHSTRILGEALAQTERRPRVWLNASTATIYRHALDSPQDERTGEIGGAEANAPATWRFSIEVATSWESAFFAAKVPGVRQVALRSAMTMSPDKGGVFSVLHRLVRWGFGGTLGSGRQMMSWIHEYDFCRAVEFLLEREDLDGAVNLTSPRPLPNAEFMRLLREACRQPIGLPATEWMIRIGAFILRTESELVLKSRRVLPTRLEQAGFCFEYPEWGRAAADLVSRSR